MLNRASLRFYPSCTLRSFQLRHSSGAAKPGWHTPRNQRWGPEIPDNQYYWDHPTYSGFVLWLRGIRPYLEKVIGDGYDTARYIVMDCTIHPLKTFVVSHNPDIRLQAVAFLSFYFSAQSINMWLNRYYQQLMDLKQLKALAEAKQLQTEGFWLSESEDLDQRVQNYSDNHARLNALWSAALTEASESSTSDEGFNRLCHRLEIKDDVNIPASLPTPITWRFNMIPYGAQNPAATTFPIPSHEQPHRAFALNFTYNNLAYDWGDYINRRDNKNALMRPSRMMFTDVYIPPTK